MVLWSDETMFEVVLGKIDIRSANASTLLSVNSCDWIIQRIAGMLFNAY